MGKLERVLTRGLDLTTRPAYIDIRGIAGRIWLLTQAGKGEEGVLQCMCILRKNRNRTQCPTISNPPSQRRKVIEARCFYNVIIHAIIPAMLGRIAGLASSIEITTLIEVSAERAGAVVRCGSGRRKR